MVNHEIDTRFPQLEILIASRFERSVTKEYLDRHLSDVLKMYVKKEDLNRLVDARTNLVAENKVYMLLATQAGLQSILRNQTQELAQNSERVIESSRSRIEAEVDNAIKKKLNDGDGRLLVEQVSSEVSSSLRSSSFSMGFLGILVGAAGALYFSK
jgi:hypothetical protein